MNTFEGAGFLFASHFAGRILGTGCRICLIVLKYSTAVYGLIHGFGDLSELLAAVGFCRLNYVACIFISFYWYMAKMAR
jgi:hypothetical protein